MTGDLTDWPRVYHQPGGGDAFLFFAVYGRFPADVEVSSAEYRTAGVPQGTSLRKLNRAQSPGFPFSSEAIGELLRPKQPALFAAVQQVPECMILQGTVADPANLNYLRDAIGLILYLLDHGGIAAIDPQQFKLYDAAAWRTELFAPASPDLALHAVIFSSDEAGGRRWIRTRGLRKFGRPDLSLHNVIPEHQNAVIELFNRFVLFQAQGGVIADGQEIQMGSLPGLICRHAGGLDDPDFNNVHVEMSWS